MCLSITPSRSKHASYFKNISCNAFEISLHGNVRYAIRGTPLLNIRDLEKVSMIISLNAKFMQQSYAILINVMTSLTLKLKQIH